MCIYGNYGYFGDILTHFGIFSYWTMYIYVSYEYLWWYLVVFLVIFHQFWHFSDLTMYIYGIYGGIWWYFQPFDILHHLISLG